MSIFHSVTFAWWQVSLFKISLVTFGIAVGAYWNEFFGQYLVPLLVVAILTGLYITYVWFRQ